MYEILKHHFELTHGIKGLKKASLKPLSLGDELKAMAMIESLPPLSDEASNAILIERQVQETLIYWQFQLNLPDLTEKLSWQFLLDNLSSDDYRVILNAAEVLRTKSHAAGEVHPH